MGEHFHDMSRRPCRCFDHAFVFGSVTFFRGYDVNGHFVVVDRTGSVCSFRLFPML